MAWKWCLHCNRCYKSGEFRLCCEGDRHCPYEDCTGFAFLDGWNWAVVQKANPHYPKIPERNRLYELYSTASLAKEERAET